MSTNQPPMDPLAKFEEAVEDIFDRSNIVADEEMGRSYMTDFTPSYYGTDEVKAATAQAAQAYADARVEAESANPVKVTYGYDALHVQSEVREATAKLACAIDEVLIYRQPVVQPGEMPTKEQVANTGYNAAIDHIRTELQRIYADDATLRQARKDKKS